MATRKTKQAIFWVAIAVALAGTAVWAGLRLASKKTDTSKKPDGSTAANPTPSAGKSESGALQFPLVNGSRGEDVKRLQRALNKDLDGCDDFVELKIDGIVGPKTIAAANRSVGEILLTDSDVFYDYVESMGC